jgi:hypothetical protein
MRPPDKRERPAATPGVPQKVIARGPTVSLAELADRLDARLDEVRCRCGPCPVHRPQPEPEPECRPAPPPMPGDPFWSAELAELAAELGSLEAANRAVNGQEARRVA